MIDHGLGLSCLLLRPGYSSLFHRLYPSNANCASFALSIVAQCRGKDAAVWQSLSRVIHNFSHLGGTMSLVEVENLTALQSFTLGGLGACSPGKFWWFQVFWATLRYILRHTESSLLAELLEHWNYFHYLLSIPIPVIVQFCMHKSIHACTTRARIADWLCDSTRYYDLKYTA